MKKILFILILIAIILQSFLAIEGTKQKNIDAWNAMGNDGTALKINLSGDRDFIFNNISLLSSKYNANFMKNTTIWQNDQDYILVKSLYLSHEFEYQFNFFSGNMLTQDNNFNSQYISTNVTNDIEQIGHLNVPLSEPNMEIWTLKKLKNSSYPMDGTYYVQVGNFQNSKAFIEECSQLFMIEPSELLSTNNDFIEMPFSILKVLNVIICFLILIVLIYYYFNSIKRMFILKINGYSIWKIYWNLNKIFLMLEMGSFIVLPIFLLALVKNPNKIFMIYLISQLLILLGVTVLGSLTSILMLQSLNIVAFIKGKNYQNILIGFNYFFKLVILSVIVFILSYCLANLSQSEQIMRHRKGWREFDSFAVLDYYDSVNYKSYEENNNRLLSIKTYYELMEEKGAIYAQYFQEDNVMKINNNYLEYLNLFDQNGKKLIDFSKSKDRLYILPLSEMGKENTIIEHIHPNDRAYSILYYDNLCTNLFFLMDTRVSSEPYHNNLIFDIVTADNMDELEVLNITSTGINSPLKIPTNMIEVDEINEVALNYINSEFGRPIYHTIKNVFAYEDMMTLTIYKNTILALVITIIIYLFITFQTSRIFIEANMKNLTIKKLHGFSFKKRYDSFIQVQIVINLIIIILFVILCIIFMNSTANNLYINIIPQYKYLIVGLLLVVFDTILTYGYIRSIETKKLAQYIKGENYGNH